jgi:hypothetical protein
VAMAVVLVPALRSCVMLVVSVRMTMIRVA